MRKIVAILGIPTVIAAVVVVAARRWRRNPRIGTAFVNSVVNPMLIRRGLAGHGRSEIGELEHVGRKSGIRRLTPVHPEPTSAGFRIIMPLGRRSEWARNVINAGHCRLLLHDHVFELDEPAIVDAAAANDLPWPVRRVMSALGFQYLYLRTFAAREGTLDTSERDAFEGAASYGSLGSAMGRDEAVSVR